jgi:hypothetical protein
MTDRTIVTIKNDFSQAKCTKHYIDDYSEKKDACKGTAWADRVHLHKYPGQWTVKPAKGTDGKCFNIINHEKPAGCLRYLSASSDCKARHLKLVEKDDGSGLQQWKFAKPAGALVAEDRVDLFRIAGRWQGCLRARTGCRGMHRHRHPARGGLSGDFDRGTSVELSDDERRPAQPEGRRRLRDCSALQGRRWEGGGRL